jgi:hypothetical protein
MHAAPSTPGDKSLPAGSMPAAGASETNSTRRRRSHRSSQRASAADTRQLELSFLQQYEAELARPLVDRLADARWEHLMNDWCRGPGERLEEYWAGSGPVGTDEGAVSTGVRADARRWAERLVARGDAADVADELDVSAWRLRALGRSLCLTAFLKGVWGKSGVAEMHVAGQRWLKPSGAPPWPWAEAGLASDVARARALGRRAPFLRPGTWRMLGGWIPVGGDAAEYEERGIFSGATREEALGGSGGGGDSDGRLSPVREDQDSDSDWLSSDDEPDWEDW